VSSEEKQKKTLSWKSSVEKFEEIVVIALAILLVVIVASNLAVVAYLVVRKLGAFATSVDTITEVQQAALNGFSGVLLVLLGLELLDTVKVYFLEHSIRVEVILLVGLIAMGRHVLQIDPHNIDPLVLLGFSSLLLALAISYFLVKRAQFSAIKEHGREENGEIWTGK
jgi:uncharacterized membrane protein (DUF373 family)